MKFNFSQTKYRIAGTLLGGLGLYILLYILLPIDEVEDAIIVFLVLFLLYQAVYIRVFFSKQKESSIRESEKLQKENLHSRLHALQNQTNPHFLFNSLNVLTSLIEENPKVAVEFVKKLSDVYRYVLQRSDNHLIELRDEIKFIESYIFLQKKRFGNNLISEIDIPNRLMDYFIPPFTLQILFENAIKHNIVSSDKPLTIKVLVKNETKLVITNNLQLKSSSSGSTGLGLENIKSRYKILSHENIEIIDNSSDFEVIIPLLKFRSQHEDSNN
jgi:LytS/YehU family sensor histidine kinase